MTEPVSMKIIAEHTFDAAGQSSFAAFSGDANPMHVDEVAARRTVFGARVVHGVHLALWGLESWFRQRPGGAETALAKLTATFSRGVLVGETVQAAVEENGPEFRLSIRRDGADMTFLQGRLGKAAAYGQTLPTPVHTNCRELDFAAASQSEGVLPLSFCGQTAGMLFPHLAAALPPWQLAALLATTRLVGMECPGLHSLYSALDLDFNLDASGPPAMSYRVEKADPRFALLRLAVQGPGFKGKLRTFVRPAPSRQADFHELAKLVEKGEFAGQRAVVVGGSRGLGEVTAKLLAAGGAAVVITYHRGKTDAEAVAAGINSDGGRCVVASFDSNHPAPIEMVQPATHLYYFATPHITADKADAFSAGRFTEFCRLYVTGFARTLLQISREAPTFHVLYPSTIFLDEPAANLAEYCAAKAAGEEVCRQLGYRFPGWRIHAPRLPRLRTDQNNALIPVDAEAPELVILRELRGMQ